MGLRSYSLLGSFFLLAPFAALAADGDREFHFDELLQIGRKERVVGARVELPPGYKLLSDSDCLRSFSPSSKQLVCLAMNQEQNRREVLWIDLHTKQVVKAVPSKDLISDSIYRVFSTPLSSKSIFLEATKDDQYKTQCWLWDDKLQKSTKMGPVLNATYDTFDKMGSLSPDGSMLALMTYEGSGTKLSIIDANTGVVISSKDNLVMKTGPNVQWSGDSKKLLLGSTHVVDAVSPLKVTELSALHPNYHAHFSSDSKTILQPRYATLANQKTDFFIDGFNLRGNRVFSSRILSLPGVESFLSISGDKALVLTGENKIKAVDIKSKKSEVVFDGQDSLKGLFPWNIRFSNSLNAVVQIGSKGEPYVFSTGLPKDLQSMAKKQITKILQKPELDLKEKSLLYKLLPHFFNTNSPYYGMPKPNNTELASFYDQLKWSQEAPEKVSADTFDSPFLTASAISMLLNKQSDKLPLSQAQAQKLLQSLARDKTAEPANMAPLLWLAKKAAKTSDEALALFQNSSLLVRKEAEKALGLNLKKEIDSKRAEVFARPDIKPKDALRSLVGFSPVCSDGPGSGVLSADGRFLYCGNESSPFSIIDLESGKIRFSSESSGYVFFSKDSAAFYYRDKSNTLNKVDLADFSAHVVLQTPLGSREEYISEDEGKVFLAGFQSNIYDTKTKHSIALNEISCKIRESCFYSKGWYRGVFSKDNKTLAIWGGDNKIYLFDASNGKLKKSFDAIQPYVDALIFGDDGNVLYYSSRTGGFGAIDLVSEKSIYTHHNAGGNSYQMENEGFFSELNLEKGVINLFEAETGQLVEKRQFTPVTGEAYVRSYSLQGSKVLFGRTPYSSKGLLELHNLFDPIELKKRAAEEIKLLWKKEGITQQELALFLNPKYAQPGDPTDPKLKLLIQSLKIAKNSAEQLTAEALNIKDAPHSYYLQILEAAQTPEAVHSQKFNPTPEQAQEVIRVVLQDNRLKKESYNAIAWLIGKSGLTLDEKTLSLFQFEGEELKREVETLLATDRAKFKGFPSLAAIQFVKALLAYSDADYACLPIDEHGVGGGSKNPIISKILSQFQSYGSVPHADRVLFAKLARYLLEHKKLCEIDRNLLLRAMKDWRSTTAAVQYDLACAVNQSVSSQPMNTRSLAEATTLFQTIGLRSTLSQSAWLEQIRAFGESRVAKGSALSEVEKDIYQGLLRYTLGNADAHIKVGATRLSLPQSPANPGSILKLCRIFFAQHEALKKEDSSVARSLYQGTSLFLQQIRESLDKKRLWPEGFEFDVAQPNQTLRQEFEAQGMQDDLKAVVSNCSELPGGSHSQASSGGAPTNSSNNDDKKVVAPKVTKSAPKTTAPKSKPKRRKGDFNPAGR